MANRVGGDFMPLRVEIVDEGDALLHLLGAAAEIDVGGAAALVRGFVEISLVVGEVIDAAHEKGEMNAVGVLVQLAGEIGELLPALEFGAIVEGDGDELRRTIGRVSGRAENERRQKNNRRGENVHAARSTVSATVESALSR